MNLVIPIEKFNIQYIFFENSVKNTIIDDSEFIKIIYSNELVSLNNLYLSFKFNAQHFEENYNKRKYYFSNRHLSLIKNIVLIEKQILQLLNYTHLEPMFTIRDSIEKGYIQCMNNNNNNSNINNNKNYNNYNNYNNNYNYNKNYNNQNKFSDNNSQQIILKISGLWITKTKYGLIYKFIEPNN